MVVSTPPRLEKKDKIPPRLEIMVEKMEKTWFFLAQKTKNTEIRIYKAARSHKIVLENNFLKGEYDNQGDFPTPFLNHPWSNLAIWMSQARRGCPPVSKGNPPMNEGAPVRARVQLVNISG